ncbi:S8 family serine peptidase [Aliiglaciecola sp. CAU 1673]|uniref:S8 family peptidase n=1 Tax=Aliiglaciecola sp. CAU 1673 TaxID=3032595 RepID=UPI0023DC4162|nr:S8 family serine peptidase [Aliiglaciecola sp. CAU 1673]MDF2178978.1 S8 family serine peptidase [Aliiglaciecola sp. CAU 1673]
MKNEKTSSFIASLSLLALGVSVHVSAESYLIIGKNGGLPNDIAQQISDAGGTMKANYPFGLAVAESNSAQFSKKIRGVQAVVADVGFDTANPVYNHVEVEAGFPPNSGDDDFFFDRQWGHNFVGAQQAWAAGVRGQGVRVAVLDGGFDIDHPDLAPNLNLALSADFTGEGLQYTLPDTFSHGSHVAGTILAADNGFGVIGVAPEAELVAVKVLGDAGSGSFANVIAGIYHAAMVDADVINMSLGAMVPRSEESITQLANAVRKAVAFTEKQGTTVIYSAGNDGQNQDGDGNIVRFMDTAEKGIPISALTTLNWAGNPENATLVPASYTNYGTSGVDFGAPGGSADYPGNEICTVNGRTLPCWVFDLVFSVGNNGWYWSAGTSMASPHAAGVAALIISENGGDMDPAHVKREMRKRAIDMGKPGKDDYYGHGVAHSGY